MPEAQYFKVFVIMVMKYGSMSMTDEVFIQLFRIESLCFRMVQHGHYHIWTKMAMSGLALGVDENSENNRE